MIVRALQYFLESFRAVYSAELVNIPSWDDLLQVSPWWR